MRNKLMTGKLEKKIIQTIAAICTIMAATISASACLWAWYQPEEPECLRK
jgi:AgrD protein